LEFFKNIEKQKRYKLLKIAILKVWTILQLPGDGLVPDIRPNLAVLCPYKAQFESPMPDIRQI
jgi:hypothetical protein